MFLFVFLFTFVWVLWLLKPPITRRRVACWLLSTTDSSGRAAPLPHAARAVQTSGSSSTRLLLHSSGSGALHTPLRVSGSKKHTPPTLVVEDAAAAAAALALYFPLIARQRWKPTHPAQVRDPSCGVDVSFWTRLICALNVLGVNLVRSWRKWVGAGWNLLSRPHLFLCFLFVD